MEVKLGRVSWEDLQLIRVASSTGSNRSEPIKEITRKFIDGLAKAIDMETRAKEFDGNDLNGSVILSIDLKIEPYKRLDFKIPTKRISLKELDELANERKRRAIEEEARLKRIAEQIEAGQQDIAGLPLTGGANCIRCV
ncbi:hypothetical protein F4827_001058 [Paraburkholderia bannensis]|jgi:hypothetical protein|uniref:Uncharacterized protein n=1 Tax=Paraburkholderia bannensis TaxID=765414 RepID=A0A7W9WRH9_9BURK|nr:MULTISPECIES: hypothetical protein [Paraburkholderia]MBB3256232.1 hypothetical protein [Paraburkholderia sp. WP4_3_2]MBB6101232.1 hypothetical protein [Paraburkholderia bannensis]